MSELIVKISGDAKNLSNEYKKVAKQTEDLERQITAATKASAAAFVGFAGAIGLAANEASKIETINTQFEVLVGNTKDAQAAVKDLSDFAASTPFQFQDIAKAGQQLLGFGFEAGELRDRLREIGDVSAAVGAPLNDLTLIFGQVRAAGKLTGERLLQLQERAVPIGPALAQTLGVAETSIKDLVSQGKVSFDEFAEAFQSISAEGGLAFRGLEKRSQTFGGVLSTLQDNFQLFAADIGKEFLPVLKTVAGAFTDLFQFLRSNPIFTRVAAKVLALGVALTGLTTILGTGAIAFFKIRAAMLAANVATRTLSVGVKGLVGATGIGLLIIVASEILANWSSIWPKISEIYEDFANGVIKWTAVVKTALSSLLNVVVTFGGAIGDALVAASTFDLENLNKSLDKAKETLVNAASTIAEDVKKEIENQDRIIDLKVAARRESEPAETGAEVEQTKKKEEAKTAVVDAETQKRIQALKDEQEILALQREEATQQEIEFLERRQEIRNADREARQIENEEEQALALENIQAQRELLDEQELEYLERKREEEAIRREEEVLAAESFNQLSLDKQRQFREQLNQQNQKARVEDIKNQKQSYKLKNQLDQQRQQAALGFAQATGQALIALAGGNSKASLILSKAFAVADVFVKDAQARAAAVAAAASAAAIAGPAAPAVFASTLAGLQASITTNTGLALGTIAAQTVTALAANKGGMVPRNMGIPGVDSVSALLTPGELVVPEQNFDEVVNAVASQRSASNGGSGGTTNNENTRTQVININGDVLADDVFVDNLIERINEAVEDRNAALSATVLV